MADSRSPATRRALVKNVVDTHDLCFVFQVARKEASLVAPYKDEALIPSERHRVVPKRDHEHAAGRQFDRSLFDEVLDGTEIRQVSNRVSHAEDGRRRSCNVSLKTH